MERPRKQDFRGRFCGEMKTAPGNPGTVFQVMLNYKSGGILTKTEIFILAADHLYQQRVLEIQREHTDIVFAVDLGAFVANTDFKGLDHGDRDKLLHLTEGMEQNMELMHFAPPILYKNCFFEYNKMLCSACRPL